MLRTALVVVALVAPNVVSAQSTSCTTQRIGSTSYTTCSNGYSSTSRQVGRTTYTNDNAGGSAAARRIQSTTYYDDNRGVRGSTQRIGSIDYLNHSGRGSSSSGTSIQVGNSRYLSIYGNDGSSVTGTTQRVGSMSYGTYRVDPPKAPRYSWQQP